MFWLLETNKSDNMPSTCLFSPHTLSLFSNCLVCEIGGRSKCSPWLLQNFLIAFLWILFFSSVSLNPWPYLYFFASSIVDLWIKCYWSSFSRLFVGLQRVLCMVLTSDFTIPMSWLQKTPYLCFSFRIMDASFSFWFPAIFTLLGVIFTVASSVFSIYIAVIRHDAVAS